MGCDNESPSQQPSYDRSERVHLSEEAEDRGLAEPFKGITTDDEVVSDLFPIRSTGVSTAPVSKAAEVFLATLSPEQRAKTVFPVDDPEWRKWMNQHYCIRQGTGFDEITEEQREAALNLLRASLSAKGLQQSRDIMRLNQVVMTRTFMGSEPVTATSGKYKGMTVLQDEQSKGLALINARDETAHDSSASALPYSGRRKHGG